MKQKPCNSLLPINHVFAVKDWNAEKYSNGWANLSNTPFYEYKVKLCEGGLSAPFIACWPQKVKKRAGKMVHQPATSLM